MPNNAHARVRYVQIFAGLVMAAIVVFMYGQALHHGRWPIGHPWSGLTVSLLATLTFFGGFAAPSRKSEIL